MASIKVKFRPSLSERREGTIYYQIICGRIVRKWGSGYRIFTEEWDLKRSTIIIPAPGNNRRSYLLSILERIRWDTDRFRRIISEFYAKGNDFTADEIIEEFSNRLSWQSFFNFMEATISRLKDLGKQRTSEAYTSALNSFRHFRKNEDIILDGLESDLMDLYEAHLKKKGLIPNSISFHMRILRAVYNRAVEKGLTENRNPFRHVYTGVDKTARRALDINTLKK